MGPNARLTPDQLTANLLADGTLSANLTTGEIYKRGRKVGWVAKNGYVFVTVTRPGGGRTHLTAHRIVWIASYGVPEPGLVICHLNNNKTDNRIENLLLATDSENKRMAWRDGLCTPRAKLSDEVSRQLAAEYAAGEVTHELLAKKYGITRGHVGWIIDKYLGKADRRRKIDPAVAAQAVADYRAGLGARRAIARRYGISNTHLQRLLAQEE